MRAVPFVPVITGSIALKGDNASKLSNLSKGLTELGCTNIKIREVWEENRFLHRCVSYDYVLHDTCTYKDVESLRTAVINLLTTTAVSFTITRHLVLVG